MLYFNYFYFVKLYEGEISYETWRLNTVYLRTNLPITLIR